MRNYFENSLEYVKTDKENTGTFRNGRIDMNCRFQHVIQRTYRRLNLLSCETGWYYHSMIESKCVEYDVLLLCQVVMPNHTHEIYYTEDVRNISRLRAMACRQASALMRKDRAMRNARPIERLFEPRPGYVAIRNTKQLLIAMKYLRDNDRYLRESGEKVPFSCFDYWEKKHYKPYPVEAMSKLFGLSMEELTAMLNRDRKDVMELSDRYMTEEIIRRDKELFFNS